MSQTHRPKAGAVFGSYIGFGAVLDNLIMGYDGTDEEEPLKSS